MVLAGSASGAAVLVFDGYGIDPNFVDPNAWEDATAWVDSADWTTRGVLPGEFDQAMIRNDAEAQLNSAQTVNFLGVGRWTQNGIVTVNSGGDLRVKYQNLGAGMAWNDGFAILAENSGNWGILNANGGTAVFDRLLMFGNSAGATGTLNMYSGTVEVGYGHPGAINDGGIIVQAGANAYINIYGGILDTAYIQEWGTGAAAFEIHFYNTDGKIIVDADWLGNSGQIIDTMITSGQISAEPELNIVTQIVETIPGSGNWNLEIFAEFDCPNWPVLPVEDLNQDCVVDIDDLTLLCSNWLADGY
jgi:hypothetical protein